MAARLGSLYSLDSMSCLLCAVNIGAAIMDATLEQIVCMERLNEELIEGVEPMTWVSPRLPLWDDLKILLNDARESLLTRDGTE